MRKYYLHNHYNIRTGRERTKFLRDLYAINIKIKFIFLAVVLVDYLELKMNRFEKMAVDVFKYVENVF